MQAVDSFRCGITPAFAGSTKVVSLLSRPFRDHPRLRGEHSTTLTEPATVLGSPPPSRGAPLAFLYPLLSLEDHPRLRGEHSRFSLSLTCTRGSPPPSRGALYLCTKNTDGTRITPAFAGSTPLQTGYRLA